VDERGGASPLAVQDARAFIAGVERRLAPIDRAILRAEWSLTVGRSRTGASAGQARRHRLLSDPELLVQVRRLRPTRKGDLLRRRFDLLERSILATRIEQDPEVVRLRSQLQETVTAFRPTWHGRRVGRAVVRNAIRKNPDRRERRRAFYAEDPVYRKVEDDLRELVRLRNEKARSFGFRSFPEYQLSFDGFTVARLEELMEDALRHARWAVRQWREAFEDRTGERGWYPWDVDYARELIAGLPDRAFPTRGMVSSVLQGVRGWGFPRSSLRFRVDHHDLTSGGICVSPDPPRDVRIVVHPGHGWQEYMILFHEVGHAVHSASIRAPSHLLRWHEFVPGFGAPSEAVGEFFELIASSEAWLRTRRELSAEQVTSFVEGRQADPVRIMALLVGWIRTELALYLRPDRDPRQEEERYGRKVLGYENYTVRSFADSFYIDLPMYTTSYLFARLLRPHLLSAVLEDVGGTTWPNAKLGPWLVDRWFRPGSTYDWGPRLKQVSGRPFSARAFNEEMSPRPN
jgi:peptidyl-dipeptidase A